MPDASMLLQQWMNAVRIAHIGHSRAASYYNKMHLFIGLPVTILAAAVGTSVFTGLSNSQSSWALALTGLASMAAAILSALQTFLNFSDRAASHALAASKYGPLRRRLELIESTSDIPIAPKQLQDIETDWKTLDETAPILFQRFHDEALKIVTPQRAAERASNQL